MKIKHLLYAITRLPVLLHGFTQTLDDDLEDITADLGAQAAKARERVIKAVKRNSVRATLTFAAAAFVAGVIVGSRLT